MNKWNYGASFVNIKEILRFGLLYGVNFENKRNITIIMGWALKIKEILRLLWGELCEYKKYYDYDGESFANKRNITILIIIWWALWISEILRFWLLWGELCENKKYSDYYGVSFVNKRNITILIIIGVSFGEI